MFADFPKLAAIKAMHLGRRGFVPMGNLVFYKSKLHLNGEKTFFPCGGRQISHRGPGGS